MKRYASIDFLRGLAIFLMIFVHTLMRWVNQSPIMNDMGQYSLSIVILLLAALFFGGWCGLFLMVSSTGSIISMQNGLEKNLSVRSTVTKQIVGGFLLLIAAVLTESVIGYNAAIGNWVSGRENTWMQAFYHGFHMETIHAVAWCVILNGITHGILSINGGWKKINRNIVIYIILAIIVVAVTPSVWRFTQWVIPGYPYERREFLWHIFNKYIPISNAVQYGYLGYDGIWDLTIRFFLMPLGGQVEPVFPFLAVSYIGSIIGLMLVRKQREMDGFDEYDVSQMKKPKTWVKRVFQLLWIVSFIGFVTFGVLWQFSPTGDPFTFMQLMIGCFLGFALLGIILFFFRKKERASEYKQHTLPVKIGMITGLALFVIGLIGVFLVVLDGMLIENYAAMDTLLGNTYDVRKLWETGTWLWWFCVVTGAQVGAFSLLLRVTEFRGKTHKFGEKTLWFRRFGFVPFSIYNFQFIDALPAFLLSLLGPIIPILDQRNGFNYSSNGMLFPEFGLDKWGVYGIWFLLGSIILMYWLLLWLWQKAHFVFGSEWFLAKVSSVLIPSKRKERKSEKKLSWWQAKRLNVTNGLVSPQWVDIVTEEKIPREENVDSKLAFKLSWLGIGIAPISLISLGIVRTAVKKEGWNKYNIVALIISIFAVILAAGILIGGCFIFGITF